MNVPSKFDKRSKYWKDLSGINRWSNSENMAKKIKKKIFLLNDIVFLELIKPIIDK